MAALRVFPDLRAFYGEHPDARHSVESDYGVWWRDDDGGIWRVTYVHATGQVYALRTSRVGSISEPVRIGDELATMISAGNDGGPVVILAQLEPWSDADEKRRDFGYRARQNPDPFERRIPRWADWCGAQGSLARLRAALLAPVPESSR